MSSFSGRGFLAVLIVVFQSVNALAACAGLFGRCDYYLCKNEELACAPKSYFEEIAVPYCEKFTKLQETFSPSGQKFVSELRACLQEGMEHEAQLTCAKAQPAAVHHHIQCYLAHGYCDLPREDRRRVYEITKDIIWNTTWGFGLRTAVSIQLGCLSAGAKSQP